MHSGAFIEPDKTLEDMVDPAAALGITIHSGYRAIGEATGFRGENRIFDAILDQSAKLDLPYEDQCSAQYYFDLVRTIRDFNGEFDRLVEVGVYMGGASTVLAGCMAPFNFAMDMVDIDAACLRFAYERIRRLYPEAARNIRLFHGDLPAYTAAVLREGRIDKMVVHHDGAHDFNQVVRDMASLSFVQDRLHAIIAQDTHLRGTIDHMNFVDMALYAVFGLDLNYAPIGTSYMGIDSRTRPNKFQGNYFMPDTPEGFVLPMSCNSFRYPHPDLKIEDFLPLPDQAQAA